MIQHNLYENDFYTWSCQQAQLLRDKKFDQVDWSNVIEEISDLGRSEYRAFVSAIEQLTLHLLKWQYQKELRSPSWRLQTRIQEAVSKGYKYGRKGASKETFLDEKVFPEACPYTWEELVDEDFFPEEHSD
jgi:phosphoglycerate-specific signal transduction histidine kinase